MISKPNLNFWIKNQYNVLLRGRHGVGKTATILDAFNEHGLKWLYFSASTMDPWVDFIGVPKEKIDETTGKSYLDLVRPRHFENDEIEAIFLDEFNRSPKKVRNAVMELIQFKSINGKKFPNLKIIWAAINPEDDDQAKYDVEELDPAQLDRFHICVDIPYAPHVPYFREKYGIQTGDIAVTWWKELQQAQKDKISPRRLDYAIDVYQKGGDIKFVLPKEANVHKLLMELSQGSISKRMKELWTHKNKQETIDFFKNENNFNASLNYIIENKNQFEFFLPLLEKEKLVSLISRYSTVESWVFKEYKEFSQIIEDIAQSGSSALSKRAQAIVNTKLKGEDVDYNLKINTFARAVTYSKYKNLLANPGALTKENAPKIYRELMVIALHSHNASIVKKMPNLFKFIDQVYNFLHSNNVKVDVPELSRFNMRFSKNYPKLDTNGFSVVGELEWYE